MKQTLRWLLASTLLLGALPAPVLAQSYQVAFFQAKPKGLSMEHSHFTLPNGLKVYLSRNPLDPKFHAQVVVNAGGKQDPADATGIAHYLEHMLFKGTDELGTNNFAAEKALQDQIVARYDELFKTQDAAARTRLQQEINRLSVQASQYAIPGELDALYSGLGAEGLNAYTSNEETVYLMSLPKNRLEQWAMVESERFKDPVFRLFQSELETVYEEKNRSLDNKEDILYEAVEAQLYEKHPYGTQTILGSVEHLKNPSLAKMYAFYRRYYVPNNMAIVISGDIDLAETRRIIEKYFSSWQAVDSPPFEAPVEPPIQGVERVSTEYAGEEKVMLAFRTANYYSADRDALMMIDMLLDSGNAGLIKLNLVQPQQVRAAGSYPQIHKDYGAQYLWAIPKEGQTLEEAEALLLEQLNKLKRGEFDPDILKAVALDFEVSQKQALESNEGRASLMTRAFLMGQSVEDILAQSARFRALTKERVVEVAQRYFGANYVSGFRHDKPYAFPEIEKPTLDKMTLNPNQESPFAARVRAVNPAPVEPVWVDVPKALQTRSFAPGVVSYHQRNPVNDLFSFTIDYDYGNKHHPLFCTVMSELNQAGTADMTAAQVSNTWFKLGVKPSFSCGDYGFSMNLQGPDESFEKALALGEQLLWNAKLDPVRFSAKLDNLLASRSDEKKDAATLRSALRNWVRYGAQSSFLERPSASQLRTASVELYPAMAAALKKQNFNLYYTGQLTPQKVESLVRKYHQPAEIKVPLLQPRKAPPLEVMSRHTTPVKIYFLHNPGAQSNIDLNIAGTPVNPSETVLNEYYNEYMDGGMGAIMFQEVRESRALAYSTWSYYFQGGRLGDQDQMLAYIGTQADKTVEAVKLLLDLMRLPPESESHFKRARAALDNRYRTSRVNFRELFGTVEAWRELGFDNDPRPVYYSQLSDVQLQDMWQYLQTKVGKQPLTLTIVGDRSKVGLDALRKLAEVEEVKVEQLFND
ncbi:MAG: M16 family metallopeptidase [Candidatus Sericytochromatia bacterium]